MPPSPEPPLAPPGAGLPAAELFVARILTALRRRMGNRDSFNARFASERDRIRKLVAECPPERRAQRVLIARAAGMEDSSRNWSVLMTLDHLRIVHHEIAQVIAALTCGHQPEGTASTAAVKPDPDVSATVIGAYEDSCEHLLATVAAATSLKTALRFPHPWFGPLDAHGWHALAAGHLGIHRVQLERIVRGLSCQFADSSAGRSAG